MLHEFAPAKLNLYLHITGRQPTGYHDLDSLVAFANIGDDIRLEPSSHFSFVVEGPQAPLLHAQPTTDNLVVKAASSFAALVGKPLNVKITLVKNLPVASGIGGGSSDAAAALRILAHYWNIPLNDDRLLQAARQHGQDVPVCLILQNNYITATGSQKAQALPLSNIVLINPNKALATPAVYEEYRKGSYGFRAEAPFTKAPQDLETFVALLKERDNSLFLPACHLLPEIGHIIKDLKQSGSLLARMSGSGATCFGIYPNEEMALHAAHSLSNQHADWWIRAGYIPYLAVP